MQPRQKSLLLFLDLLFHRDLVYSVNTRQTRSIVNSKQNEPDLGLDSDNYFKYHWFTVIGIRAMMHEPCLLSFLSGTKRNTV